jgi:predicted nucleic acid-binding protein
MIVLDASVALKCVLPTSPILHAYPPLLNRALEISLQTRSGVPDCAYIALAEREGCDMVSADEKLVNNVEMQFPFVKLLSKT